MGSRDSRGTERSLPFTLDPDRTALIVVDMQNDFVREGAPLEVPDARATIPRIARLADSFRSAGLPVAFTRFLAGPDRTLIWNWSPQIEPPVHCCWNGYMRTYTDLDGERDAVDVVDELAPGPEDLVIDKYGYGAFHGTNLPDHLRARGIDTVCVAGTVTQICVDETARGAFEQGWKAVIVEDAVSSFDEELHRATLRNFDMKFGRVMPSDQVLSELGGSVTGRG